LEILGAGQDGDPEDLKVSASNDAKDAAGTEDFQVTLTFRKDRGDSTGQVSQGLGRISCIAARALREQLIFGTPSVVPGRGGNNYTDFFRPALERSTGGDCRSELRRARRLRLLQKKLMM
jgi:hypothetical protein